MVKCIHGVLFLMSFATLFSCGKLSVDDSQSMIPIDFSVSDYTAEVKGSSLTTDNISNFGVFAAMESDKDGGFSEINASDLELFMDNVSIVKDASGNWSANPPHYWPLLADKSLSFFAYAPYSTSADMEVVAGWGNDEGQNYKNVRISYSLDSNPANHVDLCVARAVPDRNRFDDTDSDGIPDPVTFHFEHILSLVSFAANYVGTLPEGCSLVIDEVMLENICTSGVLLLDASQSGAFYSWESVSGNRDILLSISGETLENNVFIDKADPKQSNGNYVDFVTAKGDIFMLPQTVNPQPASALADQDDPNISNLAVTFSYVMTGNSGKPVVTAQFYTKMPLPTTSLMASKKTIYAFTIDVTSASLVNLSAVTGSGWVDEWEEGESVNYPDPIK